MRVGRVGRSRPLGNVGRFANVAEGSRRRARGRAATRKVSSDRPFSSHASVVKQDGGTCSTERVRESTRRFENHSEYVICLGDDDATTGE